MLEESDWQSIDGSSRQRFLTAGAGMVRIALLFGSAAVALALIITPFAERSTGLRYAQGGYPAGIDRTVTGSIGYRGQYTVRRSVLQSNPEAVCIIRDNGRVSGDC